MLYKSFNLNRDISEVIKETASWTQRTCIGSLVPAVRCCIAISKRDYHAVPRVKNLHSISNTFAKMHIMMIELG